MRAVRREEFLAGLRSQGRVESGEDNISNWDMTGSLVLLNVRWEVVVLHMSRAIPRGEKSHFAEVSVVGEVKLGTQAQDFTVQDNCTGIVSAVPVENGKAIRQLLECCFRI